MRASLELRTSPIDGGRPGVPDSLPSMARRLPRTAVVVFAGTLALSAVAGYALSRLNDDDTVVVSESGVYDQPQSIATAPSLSGDRLPDVVLQDLAGNQVSSASLLGQPLVVNFWFSTCPPCTKELPEFAAVHAALGDTVRFVGVNHFDPAETAARFARDRGVNYELLLDGSSALVTELELPAFPATIFVAPDGTIVELHQGELDAAELTAAIEEFLLA